MLKINDKYSIGTDALNVIVYENSIVTGENTKGTKAKLENIGQERQTVIGYFATFKGALNFLIEHDIKGAGFEDYKSVVAKIDELHKMVATLPITNRI